MMEGFAGEDRMKAKQDTATKTYADGLLDAAKMLEVSQQSILLATGEMTAQELRSVKAVLAWRARAIRGAAELAGTESGSEP